MYITPHLCLLTNSDLAHGVSFHPSHLTAKCHSKDPSYGQAHHGSLTISGRCFKQTRQARLDQDRGHSLNAKIAAPNAPTISISRKDLSHFPRFPLPKQKRSQKSRRTEPRQQLHLLIVSSCKTIPNGFFLARIQILNRR